MIANKIISTIHITLVGLIIVLTVSFIALFIILQHGILIKNIDLPSVKAEELYIKWNEKLAVTLNELDISTPTSTQNASFTLNSIEAILKNTKMLLPLFEKIELRKIHVNHIDATFYYNNKEGVLYAHSSEFELLSRLYFKPYELHIAIASLQSYSYDTTIEGELIVYLNNKRIDASLACHIAPDANLHIEATVNQDALSFYVRSKQPIKDLYRITERFDIDPVISLWAIENIKASEYNIEYLSGVYEFDHPDTLFETLEAKATLLDMNYTFSPDLAPIVTEKTQLYFKNRVLDIRPYNGRFVQHRLPQSYLNIDFSQQEFYLNATIITDTVLDDDILKLLHTYHIDLPLQQRSGTTQSDLKLRINLHTLDTTAQGTFDVKRGSFLFKGELLHVEDLHLQLNNTHVDITRGSVRYNKLIKADIQGFLDPPKDQAYLLISPEYVDTGIMVLDTTEATTQATYRLNGSEETLSLSRSQWLVDTETITLDAFSAPFRFEDFSMVIPQTEVRWREYAQAKVSGDINISHRYGDINLTFNTLDINKLTLNDEAYTVHINYHDRLTLWSDVFGHFTYANQKIKVAPLQISYIDDTISVEKSKFYLHDKVEFQLQGNYQVQSEQGAFHLGYIRSYPQDLYRSHQDLNISYKQQDGNHIITMPSLDIIGILSKQGWWVNISDLSKVADVSPLLQRLNITEGNVSFQQITPSERVTFYGNIDYPYALVIDDEKLQYRYTFQGGFENNETNIDINNKIRVNIAQTITLDTHDIGFNIPELYRLFEEQQEHNGSTSYLTLQATNSFLYLSQKRRAPVDTMHLYRDAKTVFATLQHAEGTAQFELNEDNSFHLYGDHFNDAFMNNLLALAEHQKGSLYFYIYGVPQQFQGVVRVRKTILKDYKVINNVLAFVNTVPALTTFSLPQYSSKGLRVSEAYAGFTYEQEHLFIHDININSKELRISGNGEIDLKNNHVEMQLALKTDLGTTLSKVPIVGYLLFGDDGSVSTTVTVTGTLDNPTVTNAVAQDIIVAPFQLLKRTILLPVHLIEQVQ